MAEYITKEAAIKAIENADCAVIAYCAESCEADCLREIIENVPAADVVPVVHGSWDDDGHGIIICSECGSGYNLISRYAHYCPSCGARMEQED